MEKIKLMTDSASDIPDEDLKRLDIDMLSIPFAIDGIGFYERESFTIPEYYKMLENAQEIPVTSRISQATYLESYEKNYAMGYDHLINVTINARGSGTYTSAEMARNYFYEIHPEAREKMQIHLVDSKTYAMAYGYGVIKAAEKAKNGESIEHILDFLQDWFDHLEIYLGCYTLKYAQKSGRIHFATAFVGELLGMRPIIQMVDNKTNTVAKVRGDKNVHVGIFDQYKKNGYTANDEVILVYGSHIEPALELQALFKKERKEEPPLYPAGAAIVTNAGPELVAAIYHRNKI